MKSEFQPCPVCKSNSIRPVISRKGDSVKCNDCGFSVPVQAPKVCVLSEWKKPFIDQWNEYCKEVKVGIDLANGPDFSATNTPRYCNDGSEK